MKRALGLSIAISVSLLLSVNAVAQTSSRQDIKKQIELKRAELAALEEQFLAPSDADRAAYAELLSQPNTGLIRLLPREKYDSEMYRKNPKTITMRGGGAYYSFTRLTHEYGFGSDIALDTGNLSVGFAGVNYGMLNKLGTVPIDEISLEHMSVMTLAGYKAASSEPEARVEQRRFGKGVEIEGSIYKQSLPMEIGATYILRSIDYSTSDVLVAFKVVRKDSDGSAILAWRLLKKFRAPNLATNKTADYSQIR